MFDSVKAWWDEHIVKGYYKATSFIANAIAVLVGIVPDVLNLVIESWFMVDTAIPTLSAEYKLYLFGAANVAAMILRAIKQKSVQRAAIEQAVDDGKVVKVSRGKL